MNRLARSAKNHKAPVKETIISPKITKLSASGIGFWPIQDIRFGGVGEGGTPREVSIEACLPFAYRIR